MPEETPSPDPNKTPPADLLPAKSKEQVIRDTLRGLRKRHTESLDKKVTSDEVVVALKVAFKDHLDSADRIRIRSLLKKVGNYSNLTDLFTQVLNGETVDESDIEAVMVLFGLAITLTQESFVKEIKSNPKLIADAVKELYKENFFKKE